MTGNIKVTTVLLQSQLSRLYSSVQRLYRYRHKTTFSVLRLKNGAVHGQIIATRIRLH